MANADKMIKKMNFFDGLFLTQEEFNTEQKYHVQMRRRHNAYFHGFGIIEGLDVVDAGEAGRIAITKGAALNRVVAQESTGLTGQEMVLVVDETVNMYENGISMGYSGPVYVCIGYEDVPDKIDPEKGGENEIHLLEKPKITCYTIDPTPADPEDDITDIILAKLTIDANGAIQNIDTSGRIYAGFVGNQVTTGELSVTGNAAVDQDLTVKGDLKVEGEFNKELVTEDDIITLNKGEGGAPTSQESGLEIFRGSANMARFVWSETDGRWKIGIQGNLYDVVYGPDFYVNLNSGNVGIGRAAGAADRLSIGGSVAISGNTAIGDGSNPANLTVSGNGSIKGALAVNDNATIGKNLTVMGNLRVEGEFEQELTTRDDIIVLNKGTAGMTSKQSGLEIFRGSSAQAAKLLWDENDGLWKIGIGSALVPLATTNQLSTGVSKDIHQPGHNFKPGQAIYFNADKKIYMLARSDNELTVGLFIVAKVADADNFTLVQAGFVEGLEGLIPGEYYYVSAGTAGELTTVEPPDISNPIFVADTDTSGFVLPFRPSALGQLPDTSRVGRDIFQKEHGFKPGMALFYDAASKAYRPAMSNNETTAGVFLVSAVIDKDNFTLTQAGYIRGLSGLIPGEYYFVSDREPGVLTTVEPAEISNPLFLAETDTSGYVLPYRPSAFEQLPTTPWVKDSATSNISFTGGNVGVGITSPISRFHVKGNCYIEDEGWPETLFRQTGGKTWRIGHDGNNFHIRVWQGSSLGYQDRIVANYDGNVGIKTNLPKYELHTNGTSYAVTRAGGGIDYAEYFESSNGKEIKPGTSVVLEKGKIRAAKKNEEPIGVISANPLMAGGLFPEWPHKYLRDNYGAVAMEEYKEEIMVPKVEKKKGERQKTEKKVIETEVTRTEVVKKKNKYCQIRITDKVKREVEMPVFEEIDLYDEQGKNIIGKHQVPVMEKYEEEVPVMDDDGNPLMVGSGKFETRRRAKINPKYDPKKEFVPREARPEWNCVGLLGQLPLRKGQPAASSWIKIRDISKDVELWLVK